MCSSFNKIYIKNQIRQINFRTLIPNQIILIIPFLLFFYLTRDVNAGFKIVFSVQIFVLIFACFKSVLISFFRFEDYETYLGFPIELKEIFKAKLIGVTLNLNIQTGFILILYIINGFFQYKGVLYYLAIICFYFLLNFIFINFSYFIILLYYKIKFGFNMTYSEILERIDKKSKIYSKKKYKKSSMLKSLVVIDLKKIKRNKAIFNGFAITVGMLLPFLCIILFFFKDKFSSVTLGVLILIFVQVICIFSTLSSIAISKDSLDKDFLLMHLNNQDIYIKSKLVSILILNIPFISIFSFIIVLLIKGSILLKLMILISMIISVITFIVIGVYFDAKKLKMDWVSSDDLFMGAFDKLLKQSLISNLIMIPFYIGPFFIKALSPCIVFSSIIIILSILGIIFYKKLLKLDIY